MRRLRSFRESFRGSFRRKRDKVNNSNSNVNQWHSDEICVRQGNCTFPIKYLGCVEVFESKGMPICEEALNVLRATKRKAIKGTLSVTADGLRVVDGETRGLIVDQTIEKVSFCAPDRNHSRGFAYICRDGTTRRWMCHGFHAIDDNGDRLSRAVGCAFIICFERKKREQEAAKLAAEAAAAAAATSGAASLCNSNYKNHQQQQQQNSTPNMTKDGKSIQQLNGINVSQQTRHEQKLYNNNYSSYKQSEIPPMKPVINPYAIDRPHATPLMLQRQTSFRPLSNLRSQSPFKRQLSLKLSTINTTTSTVTN